MNHAIEDILDSAIRDLQQGKSMQEVLAMYPEQATELSGILPMVQPALAFPKNKIPRPARRRRYAAALHVPLSIRIQRIFRIALIPTAAIFLLFGGFHFAEAAQQSLPGSSLFTVKLLAERTRVALTTDPTAKAKLELSYSQKRLTEAQTILQQENSSTDQKVAALNQLKDQTQNTLSVVPQVATDNAINNKDDSLLKNLIAVNNQQKNLLQNISNKDNSNQVATTLQVTEDTQKTIATILAAVHDQTLANLADAQISITGTVSSVDYKNLKLTVENNSFTVNGSTDIKSGDSTLKLADIPAKTQVTITGSKTKDGIVANSITVIALAAAPAKSGEVKGVSTTIKVDKDKAAPKNDNANTDSNSTPVNTDSNSNTQPDPNKVTGGFIIEQP